MNFSLKKKTIILLIAIALLISTVAMIIFRYGINGVIKEQYSNKSIELTKTIATTIDHEKVRNIRDEVMAIYNNTENKVMSDQWGSDEFNEYIAQYSDIEKSEDFVYVRDQLRAIQDVNDVDCLYIVCVDPEGPSSIYLVDAAYEDACPPGVIDPFYRDDDPVLKDPEAGLSPNISNTDEYGWLIATGMPIHDDGEVIGYAAADISMNAIMEEQRRFFLMAALAMIILTAVISFIGIRLVDRYIVSPVNILSDAAAKYHSSNDDHNSFSQLDIHTGDEIEALYHSMERMEQDINNHISDLKHMTEDLMQARSHAEYMDHVANIDALTKVRNRRAYEIDVERMNKALGEEPFGIAMIDLNDLKMINDSYGHDKGNAAIRNLCGLICSVFQHSPVYRIGGDEFAVILKNTDLENREELCNSFESEVRAMQRDESLKPWERITAAYGLALYDPAKDKNVESVFKRADEEMYQHKRSMKAAALDNRTGKRDTDVEN